MLDAGTIYGFSERFLRKNYDDAVKTPSFHIDLWSMCCSEAKQVAIAAPRGHAKSTSVTHAYTLANVLFREKKHVLIVSATEEISKQFLGDIKRELAENEDLCTAFGVHKFLKEAETEIIVEFVNGDRFRIVAKGSEQKLRGIKWMNKRPDLIVGDDLEEDEQVQSKERREKFRRWFFNALVPTLSKHGTIRIVGTVMHLDSLLERLLRSAHWKSVRYAAHNPDYSEILWPELWSRERLEAKRQEYVEMGNPEGYSQEYLNYPIDESTAFFKRGDMRPIPEEANPPPLAYYASIDFAISQADRSDWTVIAIIGVTPEGKFRVVDIRRGRWDSLEIMDEMFAVQMMYKPDLFVAEQGAIQKSIGPFINQEMGRINERTGQLNPYINIKTVVPTKDKIARARSFQAKMRAGAVQFDTEADWFTDLEDEILKFPKARHDDQVDALAWLGITIDEILFAPTEEEIEEEQWEEEYNSHFGFGRDTSSHMTTGYE